MNALLSIEKKRNVLQKKLDADLQLEHALQLQINKEFEELKHIEVSLERNLAQRSEKQLNIKH
jgi:hypothetical protein